MKTILKLSVSILILIFVGYNLEWPAVWESMSRLAWWAFPLAVLLQVLVFLIGAFRWHMLLSLQGIPYSVTQIIRPYFIGAFFNNFLPSSTGGDVYRIYHIHSEKHGPAAAFSPVITERILGLATLLLIATTAFAFYDGNNPVINQVGTAAAGFLSGLVLFLAALGIPAIYWPMHRFLERWVKFKLVAGFLQVAEAIHAYVRRPALVLKIILVSALMHFCMIMLFGVLGHGVGAMMPITLYVLTVPLILVAAGLPISIGGLGIREATAISLFSAAGMQQAAAAAVAILFIPALLLASTPGIFFFIANKRNKAG